MITRTRSCSPRKTNDFDAQAISNTFNALATLLYYDEALVFSLCQTCMAPITLNNGVASLFRDFSSQSLSSTLLALATLDHADDKLVNAICLASMKNLDVSDPQVLANTLYALVALSCHLSKHGEALLKKLFEASSSIDPATFGNAGFSQLYLTQLTMDVERPELKLKLPPALLHGAKAFHLKRITT